jgi:hypothetical protein
MKHQPMLLPFYEGVAGRPPSKGNMELVRPGKAIWSRVPCLWPCAQRVVALPLEGATGCDRSVDDRCPPLLLAGVPVIAGMNR